MKAKSKPKSEAEIEAERAESRARSPRASLGQGRTAESSPTAAASAGWGPPEGALGPCRDIAYVPGIPKNLLGTTILLGVY